jgi:hypothetical protein
MLSFLRFSLLRNLLEKLYARNACNRDALVPAFFARDNSNSRNGHVQTVRQQAPDRLIGAIFERRRRYADLQRSGVLAFNRVAAGSRRDAHRERQLTIAFDDFNHAFA